MGAKIAAPEEEDAEGIEELFEGAPIPWRGEGSVQHDLDATLHRTCYTTGLGSERVLRREVGELQGVKGRIR